MTMNRWMIAPLFAVGLGGCAVDGSSTDPAAGDAEEKVAAVTQEISGIGMTGLLSCSNLGGCRFLLGPGGFGKNCYISGIKGDLSFGGITIGVDASNVTMTVRPGPYRTLAAAATCIDTGLDSAGGGAWSSAQGAAADLGIGTNRQCAISGISNINALASPSESVKVFKDTAGHWRLGGTVASGHSISATATCWDNSTFAGGVDNFNFGTVKPLSYSPGRSGMGCAPTAFAGAFNNPSASAHSYFNGNNLTWNLDVAYAGASATCFF